MHTNSISAPYAHPQRLRNGLSDLWLSILFSIAFVFVVLRPGLAEVTSSNATNVKDAGADPTGQVDCTRLLTRIHATGKQVYYPNGTYLFNGTHLDLSGGVTFESPEGVVVRNSISHANILQFDDAGNLIGLQHNHLELDQRDLGEPVAVNVGNLVRPPASIAAHNTRFDLLAYWYNDFGLEHRRATAPDGGWIGWYYWSWNFHNADRDGYDPARHPLLGYYRGDDPVVLDWQCYWMREYGVRGVILLGASREGQIETWKSPVHRNHWLYQLFTDVPNFRGLSYVMSAYTTWNAASDEERSRVEQAWQSLIREVYFRYDNFYAIERDGKMFPVLYVHEEGAMRGVFDNYRGATNTAAFYRRIANLFQSEGYGGVALLARHPIGDGILNFSDLEQDGVLHFAASYADDHSSGATYPERVTNYAPPTAPDTVLSVCTAKHTHTPHPSKWQCPGHSPTLFREMLKKAAAHVERYNLPRIITCYNVSEWAEGGPGLQPNMQDRFGYLEAVRDALVVSPEAASPEN